MWSTATLWLVLSAWASTAIAKSIDVKIVNGTTAAPGEFPWMVSLRSASTGSHMCGGSLLNSEWFLTAAHCVAWAKPHQLNIQYGSNKLDKNSENVANICQIYVHEGYKPSDLYIHDIALLRLSEPAQLEENFVAVRLPDCKTPTEQGTEVVLAGWGLDMTGGTIQTDLQKVPLIVFSDSECSRRHNLTIHETNICAGVPEGGKGQCSGDSGGPLTYNGIVLGIVSWSRKPCALAPYPGVFTEVSYYTSWIMEKIMNAKECGCGQEPHSLYNYQPSTI